jgi:tetratricopeptide (TPR) repeat protein
MVTNGGSGYNIYTQIFCDWIRWKTGESMGNRCDVKPSIAVKLKAVIDAKDPVNISNTYKTYKTNNFNDYNFSEDAINELGYYYMSRKELTNALAIFKLNVDEFPESSNVYDSYAEALLQNGNTEEAIVNYKKSVELNPANTHGINVLKKLNVDVSNLVKVYEVTPETLNDYIGNYQLSADFIVTIFREGDKLIAQPKGQSSLEIVPVSHDKFYIKEVKAEVTFNRDVNGIVESMILNQSGRETYGKKLKE